MASTETRARAAPATLVRSAGRLTVGFSADVRERLDALVEKTGAPSVSNLLLDGIGVLEWILAARDEGNELLLQPADGGSPTKVAFVFPRHTKSAAPSKGEK